MDSNFLSYKGALVDGKWIGVESTETILVLDPSTGNNIGEISACKSDLAQKAKSL